VTALVFHPCLFCCLSLGLVHAHLFAGLSDTCTSCSCSYCCLLLSVQTQPLPVHAHLVASSWDLRNSQEWPQLLTSRFQEHPKLATAAYQQISLLAKIGHSCLPADVKNSQEWPQLLTGRFQEQPRVATAAYQQDRPGLGGRT